MVNNNFVFLNKKHISLKKYSTIGIGGSADILNISSYEDLKKALIEIKTQGLNYKILGAGSNIIFKDINYKTIFIILEKDFYYFKYEDDRIKCGAATPLSVIVRRCLEFGISGFEWGMGIPGTIGGSIVNNTGSYGKSISDKLIKLNILDENNNIKEYKNKELNYKYRESFFKNNKNIVILDAEFIAEKNNKINIMTLTNDLFEKKRNSQPIEKKTAGCIFKNGKDYYAGKLIDEVGLKGYRINDLMISEKHANFFVNLNNASYDDFDKLVLLVKEKVKKIYNIDLKLEVEIIE